MDDQRFDNRIKNKVGDYEDPGFDPAALAALHHHMAATTVVPWYSLYRTELMVGSGLLISTLIIIWSQWLMSTNASEMLNEKIITLQSQQAEINKLQNEISTLKNTPPDTIKIIEVREQQPSFYYTTLMYRIRLLEAEAANRAVVKNEQDMDTENNPVIDKKSPALFSQREWDPSTSHLTPWQISTRLSPRKKSMEKSLHAESNNSALVSQSNTKNLSAKTLRDIEKHYQKGVGIRVGPTVEFGKGNYVEGQSDMNVTYGLLGDFILSPSLSLEAGLKYSKRYYEISDDAVTNFPLPGVDESLGNFQKAEIDSWMFEIPVTFKYRYPLSLKTNLLAGLGYSALLYHKQIFEYDYTFPSGGDVFTIGSSYEENDLAFYPGSLNISLGVSNQLKNKKILETSLYYQYGLGEKGIEKINANFLGVRGVYWFTIR